MQRQKSSENIQYLEAFFIFNNVYIAFILMVFMGEKRLETEFSAKINNKSEFTK